MNRARSHDPDPDAFAMRALCDGDAKALQLIVDRHWRDLVRFCFSRIHDADAAEDLAQEAFLALWRKREGWDCASTVRAFLFRVARNNVAKLARRDEVRKRLRPLVIEGQRSPESPHDALEAGRLRQAVQGALERLPPKRREVLELARFHGLSHSEIAAVLDISPQTVANHISLALGDLRGLMNSLAPHDHSSGGATG